jgi:putative hydrolase of the HAD superfamily
LLAGADTFSEVVVKVKAVTFDVGGTLLEPWPSVGEVYCEAARELGLGTFPAKAVSEQFLGAWRAKGEFGYSRSEWRQLVNDSFLGFCSVTERLFENIYNRFAAASCWRVFEDVVPTLEGLRKDGFELGIISNWDERLRPLLAGVDLERWFDVVVISTEVGAHKPDPKIFKAAQAALGLPAEAILHVGDSTREDLHGALGAGFEGLKVIRGGSIAAGSGEISSLMEVKGRVLRPKS